MYLSCGGEIHFFGKGIGTRPKHNKLNRCKVIAQVVTRTALRGSVFTMGALPLVMGQCPHWKELYGIQGLCKQCASRLRMPFYLRKKKWNRQDVFIINGKYVFLRNGRLFLETDNRL